MEWVDKGGVRLVCKGCGFLRFKRRRLCSGNGRFLVCKRCGFGDVGFEKKEKGKR